MSMKKYGSSEVIWSIEHLCLVTGYLESDFTLIHGYVAN